LLKELTKSQRIELLESLISQGIKSEEEKWTICESQQLILDNLNKK